MGYTIKVETNGSGGDKNVLTAEDIANCDCIIVAADKDVKMARFDGKPVIVTKVANGIHKAKELIEEAESGKVAIYHSTEKEEMTGFQGEQESIGRKIYKSLMNGVSHMLPFVIGGGILIALSFLFDGANAETDVFGTGNPLSKFLNLVGNVSFGMMFPILSGYIAMSIAERPALMPGIVGGLLAKAGTSVFVAEADWIPSGIFWGSVRRIYCRIPDASYQESICEASKGVGGDQTGIDLSVLWNCIDRCNHGIYHQSTCRGIQSMVV